MLKKTINYVDFDGNKRTEEHCFNLMQNELLGIGLTLPDVDASTDEQLVAKQMLEKLGGDGVYNFVRDLVLKSYGVKSADGRGFKKSKELSEEFSQTLAFDALFTELMQNDVAAAEFVNGLVNGVGINSAQKPATTN